MGFRARAIGAFAGAALTALVALAPAQAVPATASTTPASAQSCTVTGGSLDWGFKESFRSYISGTIANGSWEPIAPATYETPVFTWAEASGQIAPDLSTGEVSFPGGVHFTGHDGLLDTTIANPTLHVDGGEVTLSLDITSVSMDAALEGETEAEPQLQVSFAALDVTSAPLETGEGVITGTAVPSTITADGFAAFGSYETGTALDPITFSISYECAQSSPTASETAETAATAVPTDAVPTDAGADDSMPLWPWLVGGGILLVAAAAGTVVLVRRHGSAS